MLRVVTLLTPLLPSLVATGLVLGGGGCGPVLSTSLIVSAQADLDGASAAEADKYAVYEYTAAEEYLHKAREEQGYADFGPAIDFAYKAQDLARRATTRANEEKKRLAETPGAEWQAPVDSEPQGSRPSVIIKKKTDVPAEDVPNQDGGNGGSELQVVPIPVESGSAPQ